MPPVPAASSERSYRPSQENQIPNGSLEDVEKQTRSTSDDGEQRDSRVIKEDPFGDEENAEVKYRTLRWWQAAFIMIAETISLGILSLPSALAAVGMVPGIIMLLGLGAIATYTGYVLGQFKLAYPHVHNIADAGEILLGPVGREIGGAAQTIFLIFIMGSHILTFTIAMNAITGHATCTIVWGIVGFIVLWVFTLPRTLKKVSYLSIASFISIIVAVLITMIGVGVSPTPNLHIDATATVAFVPAFLSVSNIIFAYAGHVAFFSFISEFRDPREFPKALYLLQATNISMYLIVAIVVYRFAGIDVASPALGSTGHVVMKVAYGISLPTILLAGVIYGHVGSKYIYVRLFRGTRHMSTRTPLALGTWAAITFTLWVIAWIIAQSIPSFSTLLALITALFASWFTYGMSGILWLYLNRGQYALNWKKMALTTLNVSILAMGAAVCGMGLYASGTAIHDDSSGGSWTCKDNST
ncbi:amino acid transporter [Massarina eburnea CBS 473.64]|uniref:Amino acid transporter n=1 Tax=Massarina eburnea CBS 473.64 TaxID=1395130 RepID=A0A6A6S3D6_9PLEO|nr:amino acid transporter [Massarina eburnea CBS 473.64]